VIAKVDRSKLYELDEALAFLKANKYSKFDETAEIAFRLGVDPTQSDQNVRGTVALPHGTGKKVRVLVFATGPQADAARAAGADHVGFEDLIAKVSGGWTDVDVIVATPETMKEVRKLGKVLGPRGLMPNPKSGTVTEDTAARSSSSRPAASSSAWTRTGTCRCRSASCPSPFRPCTRTAGPSSTRCSMRVRRRPRAFTSSASP
jgi:ribosomal protein L1